MVKKLSILTVILFLATAQLFAAAKKNVILVVADGTGPAVMGFLMQYAKLAPESPYKDRLSNLEKLMKANSLSFVMNTPVSTVVSDSAATGTQLATGAITYPAAVGVDAQGRPVESILEKAQKAGYGTGLITTVYLQDATPAVFAAHQKSRKLYNEIARDMLNTGPDVMLGGGLNYYMSAADLEKSNIISKIHFAAALEPQARDTIFEDVLKSGYQLVFDKKALASAKGPKLLGLFAPQALPYVIERGPQYPLLKDMTAKALEVLSKREKGFFLMVEAGAIDWVLHANDQGALLKELLEFDDTLGLIADFVQKNPNTLVIITADHDTGGFGLAYRKLKGIELAEKKQAGYPLYEDTDYVAFANLDIIAKQNKTLENIIKNYNALPAKDKTAKTIQKIVRDNMGFDISDELLAGETDIAKAIAGISKMLGVAWTTDNHTAEPVLAVFIAPAGAVTAPGIMHSTELNKIMENYLL